MADGLERDRYRRLAERLRPGSEAARWWPLEGGVSAHVTAVELALPGGGTERVVIRRHGATDWKPLEADVTSMEFNLLRTLEREGFAVPAPRLLDLSGTILPTPYMVMALVDGSTDVASSELPDALRQMASYLSRLHAIDIESIDLPALPCRDDPTANTMRYLPDTSLGERIRAAHGRHGPIRPTNRPTLLHGDYWPGNVLWRDGKIAAVIDWEDAAIGDPIADLAGSRNELLWKYGLDARERFTRHYCSMTPIDLTNLPFWEISGATGAMALMGEWGLDAEVEADMRAKCEWLIDRALRAL
jgi:aminoglycoside phosphotransferase (APT) family kinase protein